MEVAEFEKKFLDKLRSIETLYPTVTRNEYGVLSVSIESPCEEIGYIKAYISDVNITLTCKVSHTHFELSQFKRMNESTALDAMIENAAQSFSDFVNDRIYVSNTRTVDGQSICSGWGPVDSAGESDAELHSLLQQQFNSAISTEYWVWSGKYENL